MCLIDAARHPAGCCGARTLLEYQNKTKRRYPSASFTAAGLLLLLVVVPHFVTAYTAPGRIPSTCLPRIEASMFCSSGRNQGSKSELRIAPAVYADRGRYRGGSNCLKIRGIFDKLLLAQTSRSIDPVHRVGVCSSLLLLHASANHDEESDYDDNEDDDVLANFLLKDPVKKSPSQQEPRTRKRDQIKKFIRPSSSGGNLVQPISLDDKNPQEGGDEEEQADESSSARVRPRFDSLFRDMPGLNDILGSVAPLPKTEPKRDPKDEYDVNPQQAPLKQNQQQDEILSLEEIAKIDSNFAKFKAETKANLEKLRATAPDSVPENAELILDQVIQEQRAYDLKERRNAQATQSMSDYEAGRKNQMVDVISKIQKSKAGNVDLTADPVVKEILQEAEHAKEVKEAVNGELIDFTAYERLKKKELKERISKEKSKIEPNADFDAKQLQVMEDLLAKRQQSSEDNGFEDENLFTTDNLEHGVEELRTMIKAKKSGSGTVRPNTLKEWQMYRAIVSKMASDSMDDSLDHDEDVLNDNDSDDEETVVDEEAIRRQLVSWKEYQEREEQMRRKAGLTIKSRMPFAWSDKPDYDAMSKKKVAVPYDKVKAEQFRAELDKKAVDALEDLKLKTADPLRREKLQREIDELKAEIKLQLEALEKETKNPSLGLSDTSNKAVVDETTFFGNRAAMEKEQKQKYFFASPETSGTARIANASEINTPPDGSNIAESIPSPPKSLFFSTLEDDDENEDKDTPTLGTMKEQKFRSLIARSGVRTAEGQESLRRQWEEFQDVEQKMRERSGLSGKDESGDEASGGLSSPLPPKTMNYDISDVIREGGDVDAEKILASIGQRPNRKNKKGITKNIAVETRNAIPSFADEYEVEGNKDSYEEFLKYEALVKEQSLEKQKQTADETATDLTEVSNGRSSVNDKEHGEDEDVIIYHEHATQWDPSTYTDQLYRNVAATMSGTQQNNPEHKAKDRAAFEEYLKKEEEMRRKLDTTTPDQVIQLPSDAPNTGTNKQHDFDMEEYADSALISLGTRPKKTKQETTSPDWSDDEEDFDDDEHANTPSNLGGNTKTRRSMRKSTTRPKPSSFTEQMPDWLRREQEERRGEEFNIFDDEDDHEYLDDEDDYEENQRQAEEFERKHSKRSKEVNIGDLFGRDYFGPDDYGEYSSRSATDGLSSTFRVRKANLLEYTELTVAELNSLMEYKHSISETGVSPYLAKVNKPFSEFGAIFRLEGALVGITGLQWEAWKKTAEEHDFKSPTLDDVKYAAVYRADVATRRIFYWTDDFLFSRTVAQTYRKKFSETFSKWVNDNNIVLKDDDDTTEVFKKENAVDLSIASETSPFVNTNATEHDLINIQLEAWKKTAVKHGFSAPTLDLVQTTYIFSPDEAVRAFKWTRDPSKCMALADFYRSVLKEETKRWMKEKNISNLIPVAQPQAFFAKPTFRKSAGNSNGMTDTSLLPDSAEKGQSEAVNFTEDDMLEMHLYSWSEAAKKYGYQTPSLENIQLATWVDPVRAVNDIFCWTHDSKTTQAVVLNYRDTLKALSARYREKMKLDKVLSSKPPNPSPSYSVASESRESQSSATSSNVLQPNNRELLNLQFEAWTKAAEKHDFQRPTFDEVQLASFLGAVNAVTKVFKWTRNSEESNDILTTYRTNLKELSDAWIRNNRSRALPMTMERTSSESRAEDILPPVVLKEGAIGWIRLLQESKVPCAVMSYLDDYQLAVILQQTGLATLFPTEKRVSLNNGYGTESQQMLGAALRVERRPDHCAVFDSTPESVVAAHDVGMKCIAMNGPYPNYELSTADSSTRYFESLSLINMRKLFADAVNDEPMQELQQDAPKVKKVTLLKTRFWEEGDRG